VAKFFTPFGAQRALYISGVALEVSVPLELILGRVQHSPPGCGG
jgi:hypothetical protein